MPGLGPGIYDFYFARTLFCSQHSKSWMAGLNPAMTNLEAMTSP